MAWDNHLVQQCSAEPYWSQRQRKKKEINQLIQISSLSMFWFFKKLYVVSTMAWKLCLLVPGCWTSIETPCFRQVIHPSCSPETRGGTALKCHGDDESCWLAAECWVPRCWVPGWLQMPSPMCLASRSAPSSPRKNSNSFSIETCWWRKGSYPSLSLSWLELAQDLTWLQKSWQEPNTKFWLFHQCLSWAVFLWCSLSSSHTLLKICNKSIAK